MAGKRNDMTAPTLHYVHDPLCGWCYAAAPMVRAAREAGIALVLHGGGLWDEATRLGPEKSNYIREHDGRIAALTGLRFGPAYLNGLLDDPATVFWSRPTIAAVIVAGAARTGADLSMLHAIQEAHYVAGRRVVEPAVLAELAEGLSLESEAFRRAFDNAAVDGHVARTRGFMARLGLRGFPGFVLEKGPKLVRFHHEPFYGRPEAFARAVQELAAVPSAA